MKTLTISTLLTLLSIQFFGQNFSYEQMLNHVKKSPRVKSDYKKITNHLVSIANTEIDKAKLIYRGQ